jgi:hypothetical protein
VSSLVVVDWAALKTAARAAIVTSGVFALSDKVIGNQSTAPFAARSFALLGLTYARSRSSLRRVGERLLPDLVADFVGLSAGKMDLGDERVAVAHASACGLFSSGPGDGHFAVRARADAPYRAVLASRLFAAEQPRQGCVREIGLVKERPSAGSPGLLSGGDVPVYRCENDPRPPGQRRELARKRDSVSVGQLDVDKDR